MMDVKSAFCMLNSHRKIGLLSEGKRVPEILEKYERLNNGPGPGIPRRLYEEQARYKMYRIPYSATPCICGISETLRSQTETGNIKSR